MGIQTFPPQVASTASTQFVGAASPLTLYDADIDLEPGVYEVSCVSTTVTYFYLLSASNDLILQSQTTSGTVTIVLAQPAARIFYYTNTGSSVTVGITLTGLNLPTGAFSGTLDTITASGNYNSLGSAWVYGVAGGSGGNGQSAGNFFGGNGGKGGGRIEPQIVQINSSTAVVIGAGGTGSTTNVFTGNSGGSTSFGNLTANANTNSSGNNTGATGGGGSNFNTAGNGAAPAAPRPVFMNGGSNGGGGGGSGNGINGNGGAGGIGTGGMGGRGDGSNNGLNGFPGSGYGAGGGGGGNGNAVGTGGDGTQGVVYVLRFT